jgi:hypothetical protein
MTVKNFKEHFRMTVFTGHSAQYKYNSAHYPPQETLRIKF